MGELRSSIGGIALPEGAGSKGSSRYRTVREIGKGGMGVVYEALDSETGQTVAVKTLLHFDPAALYRFKQEFRTLTDVRHQNLVRLHELVVSEADGAFFTMELVRGVDFLTYVQTARPERPDDASRIVTRASGRPFAPDSNGPTSRPASVRPPVDWCFADEERLRATLKQFAEGVHALHLAGQIHRDLKPSNVLVTAEGRVVILDLGVAASLMGGDGMAEASEVVGTATHMAPEQAFGDTPTPAADWYSVGVMLYEALVGRPPFVGKTVDILTMKGVCEAAPPSACVQGVPPDLDALCVALLAREPEGRPTGRDVLRRLGVLPSLRPISSLLPGQAAKATELFGREEQLAQLQRAFEVARAGATVTVRVTGASGMGKSAVVSRFLDDLVARGEALVLRGRAYERESVPYKAVDSAIDALSRCLMQAEEEGIEVELPEGTSALARVFPVLRRVPRIQDLPSEVDTMPQQLRRRAFDALRELLRSLGRQRPLVLYIDDVQWGDSDSAGLILALVYPPDPPPMLLVMTCRAEDAGSSAFLNQLRDSWPVGAQEREITVGALKLNDARALAISLLGVTDTMAMRTARAVARESRGNPFLIEELARSNTNLSDRSKGQTLVVLTLEQMVADRLERLPESARRLIEVVAVAGRPLPVAVVAEACGGSEGVDEDVALVRSRRFANTGLRNGREVVETSHDRFRDTIVAQLSPQVLRGYHGGLARALQNAKDADPEGIAIHLIGAGQKEEAAKYAEKAAFAAADKLAFEYAARLVAMALEAVGSTGPEARRLHGLRALALSAAGHASASADIHLQLAKETSGHERIEHETEAARQLLACGRVDEGSRVLRSLLAAAGIRAPRSVLAAALWLTFYRVVLAIVGLRFRDRSPEDVSREDRLRIDVLYAVATGMGNTDTFLAFCLHARCMLLALRKGDLAQILSVLCVQLVHLALRGEPAGSAKEVAVRETANRLVPLVPYGEYYLPRTDIQVLYQRNQNAAAVAAYDAAPQAFGSSAGNGGTDLLACLSLSLLGRLREAGTRGRRYAREADERGDLSTSVLLRSSVLVDQYLAADDPDGARRCLGEAQAQWTGSGFHLHHLFATVWGSQIELYTGRPDQAWARLRASLLPVRKSGLLMGLSSRISYAFGTGTAAAGAASVAPTVSERSKLLREAHRAIRVLERAPPPLARYLENTLRATAANAVGRKDEVIARLRAATSIAELHEMRTYAASSRYVLGHFLGGEEGRVLLSDGAGVLMSEGIRAPERWARRALPGRWISDED